MKRFRLKGGQQGFTFIEMLVALAILAIIATGFLYALSSSSKSSMQSDVRTSAESLARTEMEYVRNSQYVPAAWSYQLPTTPPSWDTTHTLPAGYSGYTVSVSASLVHATDDGLQLITVTVSKGGSSVLTITSYKAKTQ